jgi:uncharacterized protein YjbI with pentapeptide repeats
MTALERQLKDHAVWLHTGGKGGERLRLDGHDWDRETLVGLQLGRARLAEVSLIGAHIESLRLEDATLSDCDLRVATVRGLWLGGAECKDCVFDSASITDAHLVGARLFGGSWREARALGADWADVRAEGVSFARADLSDGSFEGAHFVDCDFRAADLSYSVAFGATFERCDLRHANIRGLQLRRTALIDCKVHHLQGRPVIEGQVTLLACDDSLVGDGSQILKQVDLLRRMGSD